MRLLGDLVRRNAVLILLLSASLPWLFSSVSAFSQATDPVREASKFFQPLPDVTPAPADHSTTALKVQLGKMLYFDPRLSPGDMWKERDRIDR